MCPTGTSTMSERWNNIFYNILDQLPTISISLLITDHLRITLEWPSVITSNYCRWTLIFTRHLAWTRSTYWGSSRRRWRLMATSLFARFAFRLLTFQNSSHRLATSRWPWRRCLSRLTWPPMTWLLTCWMSMRWDRKPLFGKSFEFA